MRHIHESPCLAYPTQREDSAQFRGLAHECPKQISPKSTEAVLEAMRLPKEVLSTYKPSGLGTLLEVELDLPRE